MSIQDFSLIFAAGTITYAFSLLVNGPVVDKIGGKRGILIAAIGASLANMAMGMVTWGMSGQGCVCQTRALVDRKIYDDFLDKAATITQMITYGDPFAETTTSGPIINQRQLGRVMGYIEKGQEEGARLVFGGDRPGGELASGNWVNPTLFADVDNKMSIAQDEIFGPVLSAIPVKDEDEAIRIANDSNYGLGAGIQTADVKRAHRVAKALRAGTIGINGFMVMPNTPFGGYKTSGLGREGGRESIEAFTETKTVDVALTDSPI
jgi:aldehyde dehydrogenase (NAD+)